MHSPQSSSFSSELSRQSFCPSHLKAADMQRLLLHLNSDGPHFLSIIRIRHIFYQQNCKAVNKTGQAFEVTLLVSRTVCFYNIYVRKKALGEADARSQVAS